MIILGAIIIILILLLFIISDSKLKVLKLISRCLYISGIIIIALGGIAYMYIRINTSFINIGNILFMTFKKFIIMGLIFLFAGSLCYLGYIIIKKAYN